MLGETSRKLYTHTLPVYHGNTYTHTHTNFRAHTAGDTYNYAHTRARQTQRHGHGRGSSHTFAKGGNERSSRTYAHAHLDAPWKMSITKNHCSFARSLSSSSTLTLPPPTPLSFSPFPSLSHSILPERPLSLLRFPFSAPENRLSGQTISLLRKNRPFLATHGKKGNRDRAIRSTRSISEHRGRGFPLISAAELSRILETPCQDTRFTGDFAARVGTVPQRTASRRRIGGTGREGGKEEETSRRGRSRDPGPPGDNLFGGTPRRLAGWNRALRSAGKKEKKSGHVNEDGYRVGVAVSPRRWTFERSRGLLLAMHWAEIAGHVEHFSSLPNP